MANPTAAGIPAAVPGFTAEELAKIQWLNETTRDLEAADTNIRDLRGGQCGWTAVTAIYFPAKGDADLWIDPDAEVRAVQQAETDRFIWSVDSRDRFVSGSKSDMDPNPIRGSRGPRGDKHTLPAELIAYHTATQPGARVFLAGGRAVVVATQAGSAAMAPYNGVGPGSVVGTGSMRIPIPRTVNPKPE